MTPRVPSYAAWVRRALSFSPHPELASEATAVDWAAALSFCDRNQLTLVLGSVAGDILPEPVRTRIAGDLVNNTERLARLRALETQVAEWLGAAGIDFIRLKGTTQFPHFVADARLRAQYDLDLFCPPEDARRAWDVLAAEGYEPLEEAGEHPTDHFPALILKTGWEWRGGDHFDPEIPLAIEVHFQFWDEETERLRVPGLDAFWERRSDGMLDTADALGYAALHVLRHLFRGSLRPYHAYELAWFLEHHADDEVFWRSWRQLHGPQLRNLEAVAFRLSREWFDCRLGATAEAEIAALSEPVQEWFRTFAVSPFEGLFHPNKDELWLHLALLDSTRDRLAVVRRRVVPTQLPGPVDGVCIPDEQMTTRRRVLQKVRYVQFIARRAIHHARALPALVRNGLRWSMRSSGLSAGYWTFLGASSLFNLGMFIYVLLYNLYLLDLGYREDLVGQISGASTAGSVAAALPAAALARRFGLGKLILGSFAAICVLSVVRAVVTGRFALLALAFVSGIPFSVFAVSLAPAIARLSSERARPLGFSISTSSSIALGIIGSSLGGRLAVALGGKRPAMLLGCALVSLALWPAARLKIAPAPAEGAKLYPRSRFVVRFLLVFALWNLATGSFNPFANTYFARLHIPVQRIGFIFSGSQLAQVVALMIAPVILRRLGLVTGTAAMLMAASAMMGVLATGPAGFAAGLIYAMYAAFQWMTDPGINTLLMDRVREQERSGASALMMLVSFGAQFVSSLAGGSGIARFGYPAVLICAAGLGAIAALAFRALPAGAPVTVSRAQPAPLLPASAPDTARD